LRGSQRITASASRDWARHNLKRTTPQFLPVPDQTISKGGRDTPGLVGRSIAVELMRAALLLVLAALWQQPQPRPASSWAQWRWSIAPSTSQWN